MPRRLRRLIGISGLLLAPLVFIGPADATGLSCAQAASAVEAEAALPPGLLLAIGTVESGRPDALGRRSPWPWTINAGGLGRFFDSQQEAVQAVRGLRAGGVQSIDIGCFQINLFHHPDAFADLESGFDPLTNAHAAARFLMSLHEEFGEWDAAIAAYHSRTEALGAPYRERVLAAWHGTSMPRPVIALAAVHVWGPGGQLGLDVKLPAWASVSAPALVMPVLRVARAARRGLPRVVTPSIR